MDGNMGKYAEKTDLDKLEYRLTMLLKEITEQKALVKFIANDFKHLSQKVHYLLGGAAVIIALVGASAAKLWL